MHQGLTSASFEDADSNRRLAAFCEPSSWSTKGLANDRSITTDKSFEFFFFISSGLIEAIGVSFVEVMPGERVPEAILLSASVLPPETCRADHRRAASLKMSKTNLEG